MSMPSSSEEVATRHGSSPGLQQVLHHQPLLARERAVMGARDLGGLAVLARQLVQPHRQPLGAAAVVHEDDRRPVRTAPAPAARGRSRARSSGGWRPSPRARRADAHQVAAAGRGALPPTAGSVTSWASGSRMSSTGTRISRSSGLRTPVSTTLQSRPAPTRKRPTSSSGFWVARQADALHGVVGGVLQALERQRQVRAALGARHRVDLVDDAPLDAGEHLPRPGGEHQVERLGRGDQHVGRVAQHRLALLLRACRRCGWPRHVAADALQRGAQVLLHVVGERLQRRDVDQPRAALRARARPPGGRGPRGTRRASCPSRWAPRRSRARRPRSQARPGAAPRSARRTSERTTP